MSQRHKVTYMFSKDFAEPTQKLNILDEMKIISLDECLSLSHPQSPQTFPFLKNTKHESA